MRKCIRARYSPMIPRANNCAPENTAMIDARNGKPGTGLPLIKYLTITNASVNNPNKVKLNPITLANCSGNTLNPVIIFSAWAISFHKV